jgi:hypothetical protein
MRAHHMHTHCAAAAARHWRIGELKCRRAIKAHEEVVLSMEYER